MSFNFPIPTPKVEAKASCEMPDIDLDAIRHRAEQQQSAEVRSDLFSLIHEIQKLRLTASDD